jgi:uncharacterized protein YbjT (DUF2867 family)
MIRGRRPAGRERRRAVRGRRRPAEVAVAALTQDGHTSQLYEVTGSRLLTFAEAVAKIAKATRRQVRYHPTDGPT